jgi:diadenosine tetraphosphate (Ap4A) HIT family hydrolase
MTQRRSGKNGRDQRVLRAGVQRPGAAGERLALSIADAYPVTPGHTLVIPRRHVSDG